MKLSARNQLKCTVKEIHEGAVNTEVVMALPDGQELVAVITRGSVRGLGLKSGLPVVAVIKASSIIVGVE